MLTVKDSVVGISVADVFSIFFTFWTKRKLDSWTYTGHSWAPDYKIRDCYTKFIWLCMIFSKLLNSQNWHNVLLQPLRFFVSPISKEYSSPYLFAETVWLKDEDYCSQIVVTKKV